MKNKEPILSRMQKRFDKISNTIVNKEDITQGEINALHLELSRIKGMLELYDHLFKGKPLDTFEDDKEG